MASWLDDIQTPFVIVTGDGKEYRPNWLNAQKQNDFNVSEFEFPEVEGTLVLRSKPKGSRFNLEFYFQGEDHLVVSKAFEKSADDNRYWRIKHPFYGAFNAQPISLNFDNSAYNVTKITGTVVQTIISKLPIGSIAPQDGIPELGRKVNENNITQFVGKVKPTTKDVNLFKRIADKINSVSNNIQDESTKLDYFNKYSDAISAINSMVSDVSTAVTVVQDFMVAPINFTASVKTRIDTLVAQIDGLRATFGAYITNPVLFDVNSKRDYEFYGSQIVSAIAQTSVVDMSYANRTDVIDAIDSILTTYNNYLTDLDTYQTTTGGEVDSYIPDANTLIELNNLVNLTISSLFTIGLNSKQERSIYCEQDTNVILLAHRLYGSASDSNIDTLIANNKIGLSELIQVQKGRKILYYV